MLGHRDLKFEDYLEILRRRWWMVLIPAVLGCVGAYLVSLTIADQYTSNTLVLVEEQKVPESYVQSVVTRDIGERLGTMQEQILSRTRLQPIIEKFSLYQSPKGKVPMEDRIQSFRSAIAVVPIRSLIPSGRDELPGFTISFTGTSPRQAQQVCSEITSMFIEENLRLREQNAVGTTDFLKTQLDQSKQQLDQQDSKMADFKRQYMGSLPGNEQTDMNMMLGFSSQLDAVTSQISRAQQEKAYDENMLAQQLSAWESAQKTGGVRTDTLEQQLAASQAALMAMQAHYTDSYPDVVKMKENIAALKQKIADNANATASTEKQANQTNQPEPQAIQQLRFRIHQEVGFIQQKTHEQTKLRERLGYYQQRVSMSPAVEEKYKELTRDHQTALQFYNDLLSKKNQSEMATSLERRQQGEQFRVMDPPDLPVKPSFPNRAGITGAGLGVGLALGFGIVLLLEFRDKSMRTEEDVQYFLKLPTLAMVPMIDNRLNGKKASAQPGRGDLSQIRQEGVRS
jgi:protein tyrosine kinase modulator